MQNTPVMCAATLLQPFCCHRAVQRIILVSVFVLLGVQAEELCRNHALVLAHISAEPGLQASQDPRHQLLDPTVRCMAHQVSKAVLCHFTCWDGPCLTGHLDNVSWCCLIE